MWICHLYYNLGANGASINTLFGVVLPATLTVFIAVYNQDMQVADRPVIGGAFIALVSLTTICSQFLWAEYFSLLDLYYTWALGEPIAPS